MRERATVLVVDDERGPRESLRMILEATHDVICARDGFEALAVLRDRPVDLITLDLNMPGLSGEDLMRTIRREFPAVELVVVSGYGTFESAVEAIRFGVSDFLRKPFDVIQVGAAVFRALSRRRDRARLVGFLEALGGLVGSEDQVQKILEQTQEDPRVSRRVGDLLRSPSALDGAGYDLDAAPRTLAFLEVLAETVERQSEFLRGHARRTAFYAAMIADRLALSSRDQQVIRIAAFLHDVGKIGVPTELLLRPAALNPRERLLVEQHPQIGARLVDPLGMDQAVTAAIRHHHEWWDGRGYADGLFGEQIPVAARIIAVADAYDAMSSDRPYRKALPQDRIRHELERCAGMQFDPIVAKEFLLLLETSTLDLERLAEARGAEWTAPDRRAA